MTIGNPILRRGLSAALLVAAGIALVPLTGCGRGYYYSPRVGTLQVKNDASSSFVIRYVDISVPFGPVDHHPVFLAPGETATFDLQPDSYDIDVFWSDGDTHSYINYGIFDGDFRVITAFH